MSPIPLQLHAERSGLETRAKQAEARASAAVAEVAALQTRLTQLQTQAVRTAFFSNF